MTGSIINELLNIYELNTIIDYNSYEWYSYKD